MDEKFVEGVLIPGKLAYYAQLLAVRRWKRALDRQRYIQDTAGHIRRMQEELLVQKAAKAFKAVARRKNLLNDFQKNIERCRKLAFVRSWLAVHRRFTALRKWLSSCERSALKSAFCKMKTNANVAIRCELACHRLLRTCRRVVLRNALACFGQMVHSQHRSKTLHILSDHFHEHRRPLHCLRRWRMLTMRHRQLLAAQVEVSMTHRRRQLSKTFHAIRTHSMHTRRNRAQEFLAFAHYTAKFERRVWAAFLAGVQASRAQRPIQESCRNCLQHWKSAVSARKAYNSKLFKADVHYQKVVLAQSWRLWCELVRHQAALAQRALLAMEFRSLVLKQGTFAIWAGFARHHKAKRDTLMRLSQCSARWSCGHFFERWKWFMEDRRKINHAVAARNRRICHQLLTVWKERAQASSFEHGRVRSSYTQLLQHRKAACIRIWNLKTHKRRHLHTIHDSLLYLIGMRTKLRVLQRWKTASLAKREKATLRSTAYLHWRRAALTRAISYWHEATSMCDSLARCSESFHRSTSVRLLRRMLCHWTARLECRRRVRTIVQRLERIVSAHDIKQRKSNAFFLWKDMYIHEACQELVNRRACQLRTKHLLRRSFRCLQRYATLRRSKARLLAVAEAHSEHRLLHFGWSRLQLEHVAVRMGAERLAAAYQHRAGVLQRTAFGAWVAWLRYRKSLSASSLLLGKGLRRFIADNKPSPACFEVPSTIVAREPQDDALQSVMQKIEQTETLIASASQVLLQSPQQIVVEAPCNITVEPSSRRLPSKPSRPQPRPLLDDDSVPPSNPKEEPHSQVKLELPSVPSSASSFAALCDPPGSASSADTAVLPRAVKAEMPRPPQAAERSATPRSSAASARGLPLQSTLQKRIQSLELIRHMRISAGSSTEDIDALLFALRADLMPAQKHKTLKKGTCTSDISH